MAIGLQIWMLGHRSWHNLKGLGGMLVEKVFHWGDGLWGFRKTSQAQRNLQLTVDLDVGHSATYLATCLLACPHAPTITDLNLWNSKPQWNVWFIYINSHGHVSLNSNRTLTKTLYEVGTKEQGIALTGPTVLLVGRMWTLGFWIRKAGWTRQAGLNGPS